MQNCPHKDTKIISHYDCISSSDNDDDNTNRIVINSSVDECLSGNYRPVNVNVIEENKIDDQLKQVRKDRKNKFYNIAKSKNKSEDIEQLQQEHSWKPNTILISGDSLLQGIDERRLRRKESVKVRY